MQQKQGASSEMKGANSTRVIVSLSYLGM